MLIAVAGLEPAAGASTTALALAAAWPTGQPVIVVEADPRGGQLARRCGGDPARGLASLTAAAEGSTARGLADLGAHLQWHPAGVAYLAAPEHPERLAAALTHPQGFDGPGLARTGGPTGELVVVADCGLAAGNTAASPLLDGADLLLAVASQHQPRDVLAARVRDLAVRFPGLAIVLTGSASARPPDSRTLGELGAAVIGWLPQSGIDPGAQPAEADARARELAAAVHARACAHGASLLARPRPRWRGPHRTAGRDGVRPATPRVYPINTCRRDQHPASTGSPHQRCALPGSAQSAVRHSDTDAVSEPAAAACAPRTPEPAQAAPSLEVRLFGPLRVIWRPQQGGAGQTVAEIEITARLQPRSRQALVLLATHPYGLTRVQLVDALWGAQRPARPTNAAYTTLARLRNTLAEITGETTAPLLDTSSGRCRLNPTAVSVDYTEFVDAAARRRHSGDDDERCRAATRVLELAAAGPLAADLDSEFLDAIREGVRRDAIASVGVLARSFTGKDPGAALRLFESAIDIDPHNENFYRDMLRLYADLGEHYVIGNTVNLLTRRLAEIGEKPSKSTRELAKQLDDKAS